MNEPQHWARAYAATADAAHVCLAPEALLAAWDEGADAALRAAAVAAVAECAQCAAIAQIARDLQQDMAADVQALAEWSAPAATAAGAAATPQAAAPEAAATRIGDAVAANDAAGATPRAVRRTPRFLRWAAAAVVVLGIGTLSLTLRRPVEAPAVRGDATTAVTPASGSRLRTAPERLHWNAIGAASAYRVEIYDDSAQSLWRSERVAATTLQLPQAARAQLQRGTFLWRVRAEGSEVEIGPFFFRVEP